MRAYINYLRDTDDKANVIYVDYFDLKYENLKDYSALHEHIERQYQPGINNYVFVDEVQLCLVLNWR